MILWFTYPRDILQREEWQKIKKNLILDLSRLDYPRSKNGCCIAGLANDVQQGICSSLANKCNEFKQVNKVEPFYSWLSCPNSHKVPWHACMTGHTYGTSLKHKKSTWQTKKEKKSSSFINHFSVQQWNKDLQSKVTTKRELEIRNIPLVLFFMEAIPESGEMIYLTSIFPLLTIM